jgi:1-acyl-sn-glycerol-3-phosphate acyltransferase
MLSGLLKLWVRVALPFFAKEIRITGSEQFTQKGPLILAVNHPNSFLDAILLGAYMQYPVHFLSRGDVFRIAWVRALLMRINMLPVYRIRDGKDKLGLNDQTFELSREVLQKNGILLVFVEGFCEHQTTLQLPLKKGAPRVIDACWRQSIPVRILPVWLQYSSFTQFPKTIEIKLGNMIEKPAEADKLEPAFVWQKINDLTATALKALESDQSDLISPVSFFKKILLTLPAMLAAVLHAPLYLPVKAILQKATRDNVHYDSVLFAVLLFLYPVYLVGLGFLLAAYLSGSWFLLPIILLPILARAYVSWK